MSYSEDKFKDHVKEIVRAQERDADRPLTLEELKELALSMGLSESEWDQLLIKAEQSLNQAVAHLKVQNYTDAIQCAEEATSINPYIKDGNAILAQSYLKLALVDGNEELFVKAENYARMELRNDPLDGTALNVLSASEAQKQEGRNSKRTLKLVAIVGGGLLAVFLILFMCNRQTETPRTEYRDPEIQSDDPAAQLTALEKESVRLFAVYKNAVERRNQLAMELSAAIQSDRLKRDVRTAITDFDWTNAAESEQKFVLAWGEAKAAGYFSEDDLIRMEGALNRIATEKKRYLEKASEYTTLLNRHPELTHQFQPIDHE